MKKEQKIHITIAIIIFLIAIVLFTRENFVFQSIINFENEINSLEYLRELVYKTHSLIPTFSFNLNGGTELAPIFSYAYFSPYVLLSYLFPFLKIKTYTMIMEIIITIIIATLTYKFFLKKTNNNISFIITLLLLLSPIYLKIFLTSPIKLTSLVFLILSFYGVEKLYKEKKSFQLITSYFLLIISNPKALFPSFITLMIYSIYLYLKEMKTIELKTFLKKTGYTLATLVLAMLISSFITFPYLIEILNKEEPLLKVSNITIFIILILVFINILKFKRENLFLGIALLIMSFISRNISYDIYPILFLFLIFLLPLLELLSKKKYLILFCAILLISFNKLNYQDIETTLDPLKEIKYDELLINTKEKISFEEKIYNSKLNLRNKKSQNLFDHILNGDKFIVTNKNYIGYNKINSNEYLNLYKNEYTYPYGFATNEIMDYEDYQKLNNFDKNKANLNLIVSDEINQNNFKNSVKPETINLRINEKNIYKDGNNIFIKARNDYHLNYKLPPKYQNKIIYIKLEITPSRKNSYLKINNQNRFISKKENVEFILDNKNQDSLSIYLKDGDYKISNIKVSTMEYKSIKNVLNKLTPLNITKKDDQKLIGSIDLKENSYFLIQIPFNDKLKIQIDNKVTPYNLVDNSFVGMPLRKGKHKIEIQYEIPFKELAILLSIFGLLSSVLVIYLESQRKYN